MMDTEICSGPLALALTGLLGAILVAAISYLFSDQRRIELALERQGIPGEYRFSLPFLGHIEQFWDHKRLQLEHFGRSDMPKLSYITTFGQPLLIVGDSQLATELWPLHKKWDKSEMMMSIVDILFGTKEKTLVTHTTVTDKMWQLKRDIVSQKFYKDHMSKQMPFIEAQVIALCEDWRERATNIDADFYLTTLTLRVILHFIFGLEVSVQEVQPLQEYLREVVEVAWCSCTNPLVAVQMIIPGTNAHKAQQGFRNYVKGLIQKARDLPSKEGTLIHVMLQQPWKEEVLENEVMTLIFAGHDTTAHATAIALDNCVRHPNVIRKIREEHKTLLDAQGSVNVSDFHRNMKYPQAAFKESLRLNPETPGGTVREAPEDSPLGNFIIPRGCAVISPMWAYSRSEGNFGPDTLEFKPERFLPQDSSDIGRGGANSNKTFPRNYIPFSQGKRNCVGMPLAYLEASLLLGYILCHLDIEIESPLVKVFKLTLRPEEFRIGVKPREPTKKFASKGS